MKGVYILAALLLVGCTQQQVEQITQQVISGCSNCTINSQNGTYLPNPQLTPGAIDPTVTQENIQQTICVSGYTATVRPPSSFTTKLKMQQIQQYGYTDTNLTDKEEDHLIALELGGCPNCETNLWPEFYHISVSGVDYGAHTKDKVENNAHDLVCSNQMTLNYAQTRMAQDWVSLGKEMGIIT